MRTRSSFVRSSSVILTLVAAAMALAACAGSRDPGSGTPDAMVVTTADAALPPPTPDAMPPPPPTPDAAPLLGYGEACTANAQCASAICIAGAGCSRACNIDLPNDCRAEHAFCVPLGSSLHGCYGSITTGPDEDDANLHIGDSVTRNLVPLGDADLFYVENAVPGTFLIAVTPQAGVDVTLEGYDAIGQPLGVFNDGGNGVAESADFMASAAGAFFIVVRDTSTSTGSYTLAISSM